MEIRRTETLAKDLMILHGLGNWSFKWMSAVRLFGLCSWRKKTIFLSSKLVALNNETEVLNTILHEIAHALAPRNSMHDSKWKAIAKDIGCTAARCYDSTIITPLHSYIGTCPKCGYIIKRHRRKHISCGKCRPGVFDETRLFVWTQNKPLTK